MSVKKTKTLNNTKPIRTSVRGLILVALSILGAVAVISNLISNRSLARMNSSSAVIADESMKTIDDLSNIDSYTQSIYQKALSHIVATDYSTKVKMIEEIQSDEAALEKQLNQNYSGAFSDEDKASIKKLADQYLTLKKAVNTLTAASADSDTATAYYLANNDVAKAADDIISSIDSMKAKVEKEASARRDNLSRVYRSNSVLNLLAIIISFGAVVVDFFLVMRYIVNPLNTAERQLHSIIKGIDEGHGDLTQRVSVERMDEIGKLANGINIFLKKLQDVLAAITRNSDKM